MISKWLYKIILITIAILILNLPVLASEPSVSAKAAILIETRTGEILYKKGLHEQMYPASTTKILTAILGLELAKLDEVAIISKNASLIGEASIYLRENQKVSLESLIRGALIKSGNDAAYAIGECVAGNEDVFLMLMNKKAAILGGKNTSFNNTNGLPDKKHLTTVYDLAFIARYAMENPYFREYINIKEDVIKFESGEVRVIKNTNKLLWNYPYANGIKTGTTNAAGQCLVASAKKSNIELIAVVLGSQARYVDTIKLFEYGFIEYKDKY